MRIVQVCPRYHPYIGGVETHVKEISERLADRGFNVEVLTTDPLGYLPKEEVIGNIKVKRFRSWAPREAYYFSKELKKYLLINSKYYDIMHAHSYHAFPALYAAQSKSKNKLVFTPHYHGKGHTFFRMLLHIPYKYVAKGIFEKADYVVCVSNYEKSLVVKKFRVNEGKTMVVPNGVSLKEFNCLKKGEKDNSRIILYVGRLEKYKGVDYLIRSLPKLDRSVHLEIVGKGPHKKALLKLTNRLGVTDRVRFHQDLPRENLLQKYAEADLFVSLSRHEAFGISVAEALASGAPCIVANTPALREWVDNENCFGIDYPLSIDRLVGLINKAVGGKVDRVKLLDWDEAVERLIRIYDGLLIKA